MIYTIIKCNKCGSWGPSMKGTAHDKRSATLRQKKLFDKARKKGWRRHDDGRDLCPNCAAIVAEKYHDSETIRSSCSTGKTTRSH